MKVMRSILIVFILISFVWIMSGCLAKKGGGQTTPYVEPDTSGYGD